MYMNAGILYILTGMNPMDDLKVKELREELHLRGMTTKGKLKPQLEAEFDHLQNMHCQVYHKALF